ncbi:MULTISPECIES: DUF1707 SHOCT-like domain-containing protein [Streptomyces]|uniref:DUF1707 and DUF2154 domain-containing protein n=1 Tax=Streptomyces xanthii TaxID=2768069 RepID=A0A7H1B6L1_9ACTN|nr:DUF1707 domain-containing protein [Streptomyces xanthii]QNS04366.1 DUF1707 and DUF2154 domain-containing protein [Streptomyces xanthii]
MDLHKRPQESAPAADPAELRASDADRDRIADILREALAEGRLDADEHAERIDGVYRAKTVGDLEPLVRDLPGDHTPRPGATRPAPGAMPPGVAPAVPSDNLVAVFSAAGRKGRWRVGQRTHAYAVFGNIEIDLSEAIFEHRRIYIKAVSVFGNVEIRVPENVTLHGSGGGVLGNFEVDTLDATDPDAPVVHVDGVAVLGNIEAKPKRGKIIKDLHKYVGRSVAKQLRKHLD